MRLRRPALAASTLGLAGALVPAMTAGAATPDREFQYIDDVTITRPGGSTYTCEVAARFVWHLGEDTPDDDTLFASTSVQGDHQECEEVHNVVTLRWFDLGDNTAGNFTYTSEGQKAQEITAPPAFTDDGAAYEDPSSEHRWVFPNCASNCEVVHTFNPK